MTLNIVLSIVGLLVGTGITTAVFLVRRRRQFEESYAISTLGQIHVAGELAGGRSDELAASIAEAIPEYVKAMNSVHAGGQWAADVNLAAKAYYERSSRPVPASIESFLSAVSLEVFAARKCYDLQSICTTDPKCIPIATSLRPVNLASPNPQGWLPGGKCGGKKSGKTCGAPLGIAACV